MAGVVFALGGAVSCDRQVHLGEVGDGSASLLWQATFEPGDLSEWTSDGQGGTESANAPVVPEATEAQAHNGSHAGIATVSPSGGMPSSSYLYRVQPSPKEAYYSAWYFIPVGTTVNGWLSLVHFWSSHTADGSSKFPVWDLNMYTRLDGSLVVHMFNFVTQTNIDQINPTPVPVGRWVHFETFLRKAPDARGRIAVWQDGVPILDNPAVATAETDWVEWAVGASSDDIAPNPAVVYVDDAAISLTRVGAR